MSRKIKILTSVFSVVLVLIMACSVDVSAYSAYGIDNLPFEYEPHYPQTCLLYTSPSPRDTR